MNHTLCTNCGRNPAKEYVRKSEGKELKLFLCPSCYEALYPDAGEDDFFTSFLGNVGAKKSCPACGTTLDEFRSSGLLGCAYCYTAFREELTPTVKYIHGNIQHLGKFPDTDAEETYDAVRALVREQEEAKEKLERALAEEDYAAADRYRLELKEISRKLYGGEVPR